MPEFELAGDRGLALAQCASSSVFTTAATNLFFQSFRQFGIVVSVRAKRACRRYTGAGMSEKKQDNRPLSPHATIYRWPLNAIMSIMHRITGVGLALGAVLVVWWLLAASTSENYFAFVDGLLTSIIGDLVMVGSLAAFWYHFCNGIRHLVWDTGAGFDAASVRLSATLGLLGAAVLTVCTIILA